MTRSLHPSIRGALLVIACLSLWACGQTDRSGGQSGESASKDKASDNSSPGRSAESYDGLLTEGFGELIWGMSAGVARETIGPLGAVLGRDARQEPIIWYRDTVNELETDVRLYFHDDQLGAIHLTFLVDQLDSAALTKKVDEFTTDAFNKYGQDVLVKNASDTLGSAMRWATRQSIVTLSFDVRSDHNPYFVMQYECPTVMLERPDL